MELVAAELKLFAASRNNISDIISLKAIDALEIPAALLPSSPFPRMTTPILAAHDLAARLAKYTIGEGVSWVQTRHKSEVAVNKALGIAGVTTGEDSAGVTVILFLKVLLFAVSTKAPLFLDADPSLK